MKKFICKKGASNYYLVSDGMGGFLCPPGHAAHNFSIREERGGHEVGSYSLESDSDWLPGAVKGTMRGLLKRYPGKVTENWIREVYKYFRHSYSRDGRDRNVSNAAHFGPFWGNADQERNMPPTHHLGYMFVKRYDPSHKPRTDLF